MEKKLKVLFLATLVLGVMVITTLASEKATAILDCSSVKYGCEEDFGGIGGEHCEHYEGGGECVSLLRSGWRRGL